MTVSLGSKGAIAYWASGTINVPHPADVSAGDLLVVTIGMKEAVGNVRQPPGWMEVAEVYTAFGTVAADTGPSRISVFTKIATGLESTDQAFFTASANAVWAQMTRWTSTTGEFYVEAAVGSDDTEDTTFNATFSPISRIPVGWIRPGDVLLGAATVANDAITWAGEAFSSPGLVISAAIELDEYSTTSGNDLGGVSAYATVTSGVQTDKAVSFSATLSAAGYGAASLVRIRDALIMDPNAPTLVGSGFGRNTGATTLGVGLPAGIKDGDLILFDSMLSGASNAFSDETTKGWTVIAEQTSGTRHNQLFGRIYKSWDPLTDYSLTTPSSISTAWSVSVWRNHDLTTMADLIVGTTYKRLTSIATTTPPPVTAPKTNSIAIAFFNEATNALGYWTQTTGDFELLTEKLEQPVNAASIEMVTQMQKKLPLGGSSGDVVLTYASGAITNAWGVQVAFSRGAVVVPEVHETPYIISKTSYGVSGSATTLTAKKPSALVNGDVLVMAIRAQAVSTAGGEDFAVPAGFIRSGTFQGPGNRGSGIFWKKVTDAVNEPLTYTFSMINAGRFAGEFMVIRGVDPDNPISGYVGYDGDWTIPAYTVADASYLVISAWTSDISAAQSHYPSVKPAGYTDVAIIANTLGSDLSAARTTLYVASLAVPKGGSTTVAAATAALPDSGTSSHRSMSLALRGKAVALPVSGQIGIHSIIGPSSDQLRIGAERKYGLITDVVVAELHLDDGTYLRELEMEGVDDWLHANFQEINPGTAYLVKFRVNGVVQTDVELRGRTMPAWGTPTSFVAITGSCQVTGSNHLIFDHMRAQNPLFFAHMGDLHYEDATDFAVWRAGMESSLGSAKFQALLEKTVFNWSMDNHDRVITNPGGDPATGLNLGATDIRTVTEWRKLAGTQEWATENTLGRTWVAGRVRFIHTDMWSQRDDPDFVAAPRTFLGAAQKQWFKDTLDAATEPVIIWLTQWTARGNSNGRWQSFPEETAELEAFIAARPGLKRRLVLIGGDSHSLQADSGTYNALRNASPSYRFRGMPSLNVSGIDKNGGSTGDGGAVGQWDIANSGLRTAEEAINGWGAYSKLTFTDDGLHIRFKWEAVRVDYSGNTSVIAWFERSFGNTMDQVFVGDQQAVAAYQGTDKIWEATKFGASF